MEKPDSYYNLWTRYEGEVGLGPIHLPSEAQNKMYHYLEQFSSLIFIFSLS